MQIEQYHRKEIPIATVGNVISPQPNSYAALEQLGQTMFDVGLAMEEQRLNVQYHDQMTAAQLEFEKRSLEHEQSLDPNNTDQWETDTDTFLKKTADEILSKIKNAKARNDASAWMEQEKLYKKKAILSRRREMDFRNASANYRNNRPLAIENAAKQPTEAQYRNSVLGWLRSQYGFELKDPTGAIDMENLQTVDRYDSALFQTEQLRRSETAAFLSDAQKLYEQYQKDALSERIIGDALAMAPEQAASYVDVANEIASREYGFKDGFFDGKELAELKRDYRQRRNIAEAEKNDRAEIFVKNVTQKILQGLPSNATAEQITKFLNMGPEILGNQDITGPQMTTLTNMLDSYIENMGKKSPQENDPESLAQAYKIMTTDLTQQQKFQRLIDLKTKLKSTTVDGFIQDIYKPETVSNEVYRQYSSAIGSLKTARMFSGDVSKNIELSVKAQGLLRAFAQENPDATEEDYAKFFNRLIETQTVWFGILPGGRPWFKNWGKEKHKMRYSLPLNIETLQKEIGTPSKETEDMSKISDDELRRIAGL